MKPEDKSRLVIDKKLKESGWAVQDVKSVNLTASLGVAVREFPTSTGPVDYALFVEGVPVGVIEAKKAESGENITVVEVQSSRYANSTLKWIKGEQRIRFAYEATDKLVRFTDYDDIKYRSRTVFSFHRPETLSALLKQSDTIRNNMKHFPEFDSTGFRKCQIVAIENLDKSFAENRPKALVQMATGAGKTFTAVICWPIRKKLALCLFSKPFGVDKEENAVHLPVFKKPFLLADLWCQSAQVFLHSRWCSGLHQHHSEDVFNPQRRRARRVCGGNFVQRICNR